MLRLFTVISEPDREELSRFRFDSFPKRVENARGRNFPLISATYMAYSLESKFA